MARGWPLVWSTVLGAPFVLTGVYIHLDEAPVPTTIGAPFLLFGLFVIGIGAYIQWLSSPEQPRLRDGEELIDYRHPTQRVAAVKIAVGYPFLLVTIYFLLFTFRPYIYPTATLVIGLYLFSSGLYTYWANSLTTYFVTSRCVIKEYRFISRIRQEVPLDKVRGVEERRSLTEAFVALGNIRIASGGGSGSLEIVMHNMDRPTEFANQLRELI